MKRLMMLLAVVLVFGFVGCEPDNTTYFTVSYEAGEGSGTAPESQSKALGETFNLPGQRDMIAPSGKSFSGWRANGQNYSAGGSFTVTGNTVFLARWASTSGNDTNDNQNINFFTNDPVTVQAALNNVIVQQDSASSAQLLSANYDPDLGYIVATVRVGTIKDMFLQYLSAVVVAAAGREFSYTEISGHSESVQTRNINTTAMNFSGTLWGAGAGAIAGANVFAGLGSLTNRGPQAKVSAYATAGAGAFKMEFDLLSVVINEYTHEYNELFIETNTFKQDMSIYPAGKRYAVAAFADVGVYQLLKYDYQTGTASAIPGRSLWFNVESRPVWDMYEYSREEELSIPQKLRPFERVNVVVSEADLYETLKNTHSETKTNRIEYIGGNFNETKEEMFNYNLPISVFKQLGYTKLRVNFSFDYRGYQLLTKYCATLRVMINHNNREIGRAEFDCKHVSTRASFSTEVSLDSITANSGQFKILWHRYPDGHIFNWPDEFLVTNRTITITALK